MYLSLHIYANVVLWTVDPALINQSLLLSEKRREILSEYSDFFVEIRT